MKTILLSLFPKINSSNLKNNNFVLREFNYCCNIKISDANVRLGFLRDIREFCPILTKLRLTKPAQKEKKKNIYQYCRISCVNLGRKIIINSVLYSDIHELKYVSLHASPFGDEDVEISEDSKK